MPLGGACMLATLHAGGRRASGFSLHSPDAPQPGHSALRSLHSGEHSPHDVGQMRSIESGLASHSPCWAQLPHEASVSLQMWVHVPHESGHTSAMYFCARRGGGAPAARQRPRAGWVRGGAGWHSRCAVPVTQSPARAAAHRVLAGALAILGPVGAVRPLVVADAGVHERAEEGRGEEGSAEERLLRACRCAEARA